LVREKMDEIDAKILEILISDARTPFSQIAKTLHVGTDTVFRRYKRLLKLGIITRATLVLDSRVFGFEGLIDFLIKLRPGADREKVQTQLIKLEGLIGIAKTYGDHDLYISLYFRDFEQITATVRRIKQIKEVVGLESLMYLAQDWTIPIVSATNISGAKRKSSSFLKPFL
jgi:Lrp/AsnC family transcriptional regulator, regulator for asnA, asnC and gidA